MYDPIKDGMEKGFGAVIYNEAKPPDALRDIVHSYWQLKTSTPLENNFTLHAIPDACINIGVEDCAIEESRVEGAGGKVTNPKMSIGEYGFVSVCMDTEGNLFGLSSMK